MQWLNTVCFQRGRDEEKIHFDSVLREKKWAAGRLSEGISHKSQFLSELKGFQVTVTARRVAPMSISVAQRTRGVKQMNYSNDDDDHDHVSPAEPLQWQILQFKLLLI